MYVRNDDDEDENDSDDDDDTDAVDCPTAAIDSLATVVEEFWKDMDHLACEMNSHSRHRRQAK